MNYRAPHREKIRVSMYLLLVIALGVFAEEKTDLSTDAKVDSIFKMQQKVYADHISPLQNKKYGIEINPVRFLFMDVYPSFSGTFSLFDVNRHAEIAFPIFWGSDTSANGASEFDIDCHYRYFMGNNQNGFYVSAFIRYSYLHGYTENMDYYNFPYTQNYNSQSVNRLGMGIGLGFRVFSHSGFYYGSGLIVGRYFDNGYNFNNDIGSALMENFGGESYYILEFELLKFGWAFIIPGAPHGRARREATSRGDEVRRRRAGSHPPMF